MLPRTVSKSTYGRPTDGSVTLQVDNKPPVVVEANQQFTYSSTINVYTTGRGRYFVNVSVVLINHVRLYYEAYDSFTIVIVEVYPL
jgi:hypothetical protein